MSTIAADIQKQSAGWAGKWCFTSPLTHPWNTYAYIRRAIDLPTEPRRVLARVSADARYTLFVNGHRVHQGPARCYPGHQSFDTLDLTALFQAGQNVISAIVHQFGAPTFFSVFRDASGFLFDALAELEGSTVPLHTPTDWRCRPALGWRKNTERMSIQLGFQEHFDADADDIDWMLPSFTPAEDSAWKEPWVAGPVGTHPWLLMEQRSVPLLADHLESFNAVTARFEGENPRGYKVVEDVYHLVTPGDFKKSGDVIPDAPAMLIDDDTCTVIEPPEEGHFVALTLSLATYRTGHLVLEIDDAAGDEIIDVLYSEELDKSQLPLLVPLALNSSREATATRYRCRPGKQRWETFHYVGMRHVLVVFRNVENKPLRVRRIAVRQVHTTVENAGAFTSSDEYLNRIWEIGRNTQLNCSFDAYVDCPWREQAMWWGDSRVQAMVSAHAFGDISLLDRGIRLIAQSQTPDGALHAHAPADRPNHRLPDFMMTWVGTLWDHYWHTGKTELVRECLPTLHNLFEFFSAHESEDGLIGGFDGYWMFLDWQTIFKGDYSAPFNLMYLQSLRWAAELCKLAGDTASAGYEQHAAKIQSAVEARFWDAKAGHWRDGFDVKTSKQIEQTSQHTNTLAILLGLKPETHEAIAREVLLKSALSKRTKILTASPFFYAYVLQAMARCGLSAEVVAIIGDKWGTFVDAGASTFPELWEVKYESRCHAWSASPVYHLMQIVLGVKQTSAGWKRVLIEPTLATLEFARGVVPTPLGPIKMEWEKAGEDQLAVHIDLPEGMTAVFRSPTGDERELEPGGQEFHT